MVRWMRWHCPPDTGFEICTLAVWGRARYLSGTDSPHYTESLRVSGGKHFVPLKQEFRSRGRARDLRLSKQTALGVLSSRKNQKIREKLGSGWVGQARTRIIFFFGKFCIFVRFFCLLYVFPKKIKNWIGWWVGCGLANPSFSRIFGFFSTWQDPLTTTPGLLISISYKPYPSTHVT